MKTADRTSDAKAARHALLLCGFDYRASELCCENIAVSHIAASAGTPCYVYSAAGILDKLRAYTSACRHKPFSIHYAVKANSALGVLSLLAKNGAGFDIVSGGELFRVLKAGGDPARIVFSGVGKTAPELDYALQAGVAAINCESEAELDLLNERAAMQQKRARVSLRVNPDVSVETHPAIATGLRQHKFGIDIDEAEPLYRRAALMKHIAVEGVSCHIGSQIFDVGAFVEALRKVLDLVQRLRRIGIPILHLDLGGGLGVPYRPGESGPAIGVYLEAVSRELSGWDLHLHLEPGRSIVGQAGILVTRVLYRKRLGAKEFVIVDAAMNDLLRPALYESYHDIIAVKEDIGASIVADIVGPVCETGDFLARDREIPAAAAGDLLAVCTAGAYGFVLSSNYNARPRAAEVLVEGDRLTVIRERETYADLIRGERTV